jgi:hypothetical protein
MPTRSRVARIDDLSARREPATSFHDRKGSSQYIEASIPARLSRPSSSTSNAQRLRNGDASAWSSGAPARSSLAPHCVSYTGAFSTLLANVANTRPV